MSTYNIKVSPPVAGHPPSNVDGGYGRATNKFHKPRNVMGGDYGIYNPVGPHDKEIKQEEYEEHLRKKRNKKSSQKKKRKKKKSKKKYNVAKSINSFIGPTGHKQADDSFAYKGVTPFHFVDSATPLRAGNEINGEVLFESIIKEYVGEVISEFNRSAGRSGNTSISGKLSVKKSKNILGDKDPYPDSSMGPPMSPAYGGGKIGRTTNTNPNNKSVANIANKKTASGSHYFNANISDQMFGDNDIEEKFDDYSEDESSFDYLTNKMSLNQVNIDDKITNHNYNVDRDKLNVSRHNSNVYKINIKNNK